jgi:hypothetical protein
MGAAMGGGIGGHAGIFSNSMFVKCATLFAEEIMLTVTLKDFDDFTPVVLKAIVGEWI